MAAIMKLPKITVVNATKRHTASLFIFHGSGGSGDDMKEWISILNRGEFQFPHIKVIYPTAPAQPYSLNNGMISNVWHDRKYLSTDSPEHIDSINSMCKTLSDLIENEVSDGIPHNRIVIGGFSMGGGLSMQLAYRFKQSLAGCFAISSFLSDTSAVYQSLKENQGTNVPPLMYFHGAADTLVPIEWGQKTFQTLKDLGVNGKFVTMDNLDHELNRKEIHSLKQWILNLLPEA